MHVPSADGLRRCLIEPHGPRLPSVLAAAVLSVSGQAIPAGAVPDCLPGIRFTIGSLSSR